MIARSLPPLIETLSRDLNVVLQYSRAHINTQQGHTFHSHDGGTGTSVLLTFKLNFIARQVLLAKCMKFNIGKPL